MLLYALHMRPFPIPSGMYRFLTIKECCYMKKKKIVAIAVMLICVSILASTTLAYFTDVDTARNVITSGGIEIKLVEQQRVGDTLTDYPDEKIVVMPGASVSKIVTVRNEQQPAWIRAQIEVTFFDANGQEIELSDTELDALVLIAADSENWTLKDGWWYCNEAVATGESTPALFETVEFAKTMGNEFQNTTVHVDVIAEAVQKANNGETVLDAAGWREN